MLYIEKFALTVSANYPSIHIAIIYLLSSTVNKAILISHSGESGDLCNSPATAAELQRSTTSMRSVLRSLRGAHVQ